jgi:hypothetical protein
MSKHGPKLSDYLTDYRDEQPSGNTLRNQVFEIEKIDGSSNMCTVLMTSATNDKLDGANSYALANANDAVKFANSGGTRQ